MRLELEKERGKRGNWNRDKAWNQNRNMHEGYYQKGSRDGGVGTGTGAGTQEGVQTRTG